MDLDTLKKLAGVGEYAFKGLQPVDENLSITGTEKRRIEREKGIKPGDPDWFKLWYGNRIIKRTSHITVTVADS